LAIPAVETGMSRLTGFLATLLLSASVAACSQAYDGSRPAGPAPAPMVIADRPAEAAPYTVEIIAESGAEMPTYQHGGRFYVLGEAGARYLIRVTNPTDRRVEAVVTVDGLDVIDGEEGDLRKRGYVVPARGDLEIEGFRTSTANVATFRFSSVGESYAGRKGKARNVGVIAVALFEETAPAELILEQPEPTPPVTYYDEGDGDGGGYYRGRGEGRDAAKRAPSGTGSADSVAPAEGGGGSGGAPVMRPPPPPDDDYYVEEKEEVVKTKDRRCCDNNRPGLGTQYGEQRYSAATWTRFVRASDKPTAVAELRYNDAPGLAALGILVAPAPNAEEVTKRETADPFPGDPEFSRPPAGIQ
jgi:hypothetical protein